MPGYSIHIGLNHVDPDAYGGWDGELSGCINDAHAMQRLANAEGYQSTLLLDEEATSQAVAGEISLLAQQVSAGDICLISYSGHGGQVDDVNGDEFDERDETWVLYDRQMVDDELYQLWSQFPPGVRVVVVSDSCHSGTVARDMVAVQMRQAMEPAEGSRAMPVAKGSAKNMPYGVQESDGTRRRGTYQFVQYLSGAKSADALDAEVILLSGCMDNQLSYDGDVNGQFTGTLLTVWRSGAFAGDYPAFHRAILAQMPPDQSPNLDQVGTVTAGFLGQRPFTIAAPAATSTGGTTTGGTTTGGTTPGTGTTTPATHPTLRPGATGSDVVILQHRLAAHGYYAPADGSFGPVTTQAVKAFQVDHGLTADGTVGPLTWAALDADPASGTPEAPASLWRPGRRSSGAAPASTSGSCRRGLWTSATG